MALPAPSLPAMTDGSLRLSVMALSVMAPSGAQRWRAALFGLTGAMATAIAACSPAEKGVVQGRPGDPVIVLSEGACFGTCPIYDMTLRPSGAYTLNAQRFVKEEGVSEGQLDPSAWTAAVAALEKADFWTAEPVQTLETMSTCHTDAPTVIVTWRTEEAKEKTLTYNAGCGVRAMQTLISELRAAMNFDGLVWTDARFDPSGNR